MALLLCKGDYLYISHKDSLLIFNSGTNESIILNSLKCSHKIANILSISVSDDGSLFAATDDEKSLFVFDTNDWKIKNKIIVNKRITSMIFVKMNILLADKSGDVYEYSMGENNLKFCLGHVSMLLHLTICKNDTYLVTCDRDEKIRVSHYPNCFDIQQYCLFHTDFVSHILYLQQHDLVISGSGDGYIALWDYVSGSVLDSKDCLPFLSQDNNEISSRICQFSVSHFNDEEICFEKRETEESKPMEKNCINREGVANEKMEGSANFRIKEGVTNRCRGCDVKKTVFAKELNILAVVFERWNFILLFGIYGMRLKFLKRLSVKASILDLCFYGSQLFILQAAEQEALTTFHLSQDGSPLEINSIDKEILVSINGYKEFFNDLENTGSIFPSLHKVHIDNISDYVERKRKRISQNKNNNSKQIKKID